MISVERIEQYVADGQMMVKIIADSINENGQRITTFQLKYPRFIHSEVMTHRVFSRNASSSRAIPVKKMIEQVRNNPAMPIHWGANQSGMQAVDELTEKSLSYVKNEWLFAAINAASTAETMQKLGLHKQVSNRILEPFQHIHVVLTATDFDNFLELRYHEDAQPEIYALASLIKDALETNKPKLLKQGEWHLPYVSDSEKESLDIDTQLKLSTARCCRVSYLNHDQTKPEIEKDVALFERLVGSAPLHASPLEHQARPENKLEFCGVSNLKGWVQYRKLFEKEFYSK